MRLCVGILRCYRYLRYRSLPDGVTLSEDLEGWKNVFGAAQPTKEQYFRSKDVTRYYRHTTNRDYLWLRSVIGAGMHTVLTAPKPIGWHALGTRQATLVLAEVCAVRARRVLELGCGRGYCTLWLAALCPDVQFDAIDLLDEHVRVARSDANQAGLRNVRFILGDMNSHFEGQYDIVFGVESLCYVTSLPSFLRRVRQLLQPIGRLVIVDGFRSAGILSCSPDLRAAMQYVENGFCINTIHSKAHWTRWAKLSGLRPLVDRDFTIESLPFWLLGWWATRWVLKFPRLLRLYMNSSDRRRATVGTMCAITMVAHVLQDSAAAEYGLLVFGIK